MKGFIIIILSVLVLAVLGAITVIGKVLFSGSLSFIKSETKKTRATVLNKRKQDMLRSSGPYTNYYIYFQLSENDKMEFPVNKRLYKRANVGDTGTLTYKGMYFVGFAFDKDIKEEPKKETYTLNGEIIEK